MYQQPTETYSLYNLTLKSADAEDLSSFRSIWWCIYTFGNRYSGPCTVRPLATNANLYIIKLYPINIPSYF